MQYSFDVTITSAEDADNLHEEELDVTTGWIREAVFIIPSGPNNLIYFSIWFRGQQIYPITVEQWYHGNKITIKVVDNFYIETTPAKLTFCGYGVNCKYDHTITCQFTILPYPDPSYYLAKILSGLSSITRWFIKE
jgi:hypothetical protein